MLAFIRICTVAILFIHLNAEVITLLTNVSGVVTLLIQTILVANLIIETGACCFDPGDYYSYCCCCWYQQLLAWIYTPL